MLKKVLASILILSGLIILPQFAGAEEYEPVQLAVFDTIQVVPEQESVKGIRLSAFYTINKDVYGLSLSCGVNRATGDTGAIEIGLGNCVEGSACGTQIGVVNYVNKRFAGIQCGAFNYATEVRGLQIGVFNYTKSLDGIQIGLGNYNGKKKPMEFMALVNWSFG